MKTQANNLKRAVCAIAWLLLSCAVPTTTAWAQPYPTKPIRFIVGFGAGGGNDMIARTLGRKLTDSLGQQVVVDNRAGGAGIVAAVIVAKAPPDGYTLFAGSISTLATNVSMHAKLPYDPLRDFVPVTTTTLSPYLFTVNPTVPATTIKEFIALAKTAGSKINYASAGSGGGNHLSQELFKTMTGINMVHVPYKGAAEQVTALIAGEVQMSCIQVQVALPQVRGGRLRALAVTSEQRLPAVPEVPTVAEAGVPGFEAVSWQGVVVPAGTPRAIVSRLHVEIAKALQAPEVSQRLAAEGTTPGGIAPDAFAAYIKSEIAKWAKVVKLSGARAD
ncbi:MAG TPA: tripartite tricarboxylate transporter substrate binding protein [Burkholderiales bacterium]|nr:tripartite tricarboxylate transporter substrate binding protein [Burkholderiales bacterium]